MKMNRLIALAFLFASGIGVGRANLGETEARCVARYGIESDVQSDVGYRQVGDKAASFQVKTGRDLFDVRVIFLNGRSCHESFSNDDASRGLSEEQMKTILDSQSTGSKWSKLKTIYHTDRADETVEIENWLRDDGATATFTLSGKAPSSSMAGEMELSTKQYASEQHFYDKENGDS